MLHESLFKKPGTPGEVKKENLYKTSAEMFSIYIYVKDPMMQVKSDKYTEGEFKKVKDLVSLEDSLLVSSQISTYLNMQEKQEKELKKAMQKATSSTPFNVAAGDSAPKPSDQEDASDSKEERRESADEDAELEKSEVAPPAKDEDEDDS